MKRKIFINICCLSIGAVLCAGIAFVIFFNSFSQKNLRDSLSDIRVSIIDSTGKVLIDNTADVGALPNHIDRPEVADAFKYGKGESSRVSETQNTLIHYYAIKINGNQVLRIAQEEGNLSRYTAHIILIFAAVLLIVICACIFIARRLTKRIIMPLNDINLDGDVVVDTYDELSPFVRKIEEQKRRIEQHLSEVELSENITDTISENLDEGLILIDKTGDILSVNENALSLFEQNGDFTGKNIVELSRNITIGECIKRALAGEHFYHDMEISGKYYQILFSPTAQGGAIILFLDVSERTFAEKRRREFSANVSHELKTPLTTIYGYAEMMGGNMVKESDITAVSGKIRDEAARLITLINDIIKLSELDEGERHRDFSYFDVTEVSKNTCARLATQAVARDVKVVCNSESVMLCGDVSMIEEMMYNLVENAIKYNHTGGNVDIDILKQADRVKIEVTDTGIGIDAEHLERVFERFYRVDSSRSKKTGGTGLGLSIVKHIAEYHGGYILADSTPNLGTKITIVI